MTEKILTHQCDAKLLHDALKFAASGDARFYLNGVHIRKADTVGVIIEATDGHAAIIIHDKSGICTGEDVVIARDIAKLMPKIGTIFVYDDGSVAANNLHDTKKQFVQVCYEKGTIDGRFPDVNRVVPAPENLVLGFRSNGVDLNLLLRAMSAFPSKDKRWNHVIIFHNPDDSNASAIITNKEGDVIVVVMPARTEYGEKFKTPDWLGVKQ